MEQFKAFLEKANTNSELKKKLESLGTENLNNDEVIALAAEYGFTIEPDELESLIRGAADSYKSGEISEEQLDAVAGGATWNRYDPKTCKNMTRTKYECVGLLAVNRCDHYREDYRGNNLYKISCTKGAYPDYIGDWKGNPK